MDQLWCGAVTMRDLGVDRDHSQSLSRLAGEVQVLMMLPATVPPLVAGEMWAALFRLACRGSPSGWVSQAGFIAAWPGLGVLPPGLATPRPAAAAATFSAAEDRLMPVAVRY